MVFAIIKKKKARETHTHTPRVSKSIKQSAVSSIKGPIYDYTANA